MGGIPIKLRAAPFQKTLKLSGIGTCSLTS
jgi:hypothetical protein